MILTKQLALIKFLSAATIVCAARFRLRRTNLFDGLRSCTTSELFFRKGVEGRILFGYTAKAKVDGLIDRTNNEEVVWKKTR